MAVSKMLATREEGAGMSVFEQNVFTMRVDERMMPGWSPDQLSPAERAKYDEERRLALIERNKQTLIRESVWWQLRAITDPAIRAVLDLHAMVEQRYGGPECAHCYRDTEMGDHEDWPCETTRAIANAYGIEMPR